MRAGSVGGVPGGCRVPLSRASKRVAPASKRVTRAREQKGHLLPWWRAVAHTHESNVCSSNTHTPPPNTRSGVQAFGERAFDEHPFGGTGVRVPNGRSANGVPPGQTRTDHTSRPSTLYPPAARRALASSRHAAAHASHGTSPVRLCRRYAATVPHGVNVDRSHLLARFGSPARRRRCASRHLARSASLPIATASPAHALVYDRTRRSGDPVEGRRSVRCQSVRRSPPSLVTHRLPRRTPDTSVAHASHSLPGRGQRERPPIRSTNVGEMVDLHHVTHHLCSCDLPAQLTPPADLPIRQSPPARTLPVLLDDSVVRLAHLVRLSLCA